MLITSIPIDLLKTKKKIKKHKCKLYTWLQLCFVPFDLVFVLVLFLSWLQTRELFYSFNNKLCRVYNLYNAFIAQNGQN